MKNRLLSIFALLALLSIGACSDDEPKVKSITTEDGITIELTWITDDTPDQAILDADLDLYLYSVALAYVDGSTDTDDFELLELSSLEDDGEYLLNVEMYSNGSDKAVDYLVTISGGGKEYEFEGSFAGTAENEENIDLVTITKAGNKFTFEKN
jgi:hypothetical protein